jgi:hypothetical protein
MGKKIFLMFFFLFSVLSSYGSTPPLAPPPVVRQFKVRYSYSCKGGGEGTREVLVDADSADDARSIIEDMVPCAKITKVTEVTVLYEE